MFFETGSYVTQDGLYLRMTLNPDPLVSTSWTRTACKDSYFKKNRHSFHIIRWMQTAVTKLVSFLSKHCPPVWVIFVIHCSSWNGLVGCNPCKGALCCLLLVMVKNYKVFFFFFFGLGFWFFLLEAKIKYLLWNAGDQKHFRLHLLFGFKVFAHDMLRCCENESEISAQSSFVSRTARPFGQHWFRQYLQFSWIFTMTLHLRLSCGIFHWYCHC